MLVCIITKNIIVACMVSCTPLINFLYRSISFFKLFTVFFVSLSWFLAGRLIIDEKHKAVLDRGKSGAGNSTN
jgi:hypothetical protein